MKRVVEHGDLRYQGVHKHWDFRVQVFEAYIALQIKLTKYDTCAIGSPVA